MDRYIKCVGNGYNGMGYQGKRRVYRARQSPRVIPTILNNLSFLEIEKILKVGDRPYIIYVNIIKIMLYRLIYMIILYSNLYMII